jgi:hypothetical protein
MDWILRSATGKRTGRARYAVCEREEGGAAICTDFLTIPNMNKGSYTYLN